MPKVLSRSFSCVFDVHLSAVYVTLITDTFDTYTFVSILSSLHLHILFKLLITAVATVVNSSLVSDPTIRLTGFDLHRRQWSPLNRIRTGQGHCNACRKKWGFHWQRTMWLWWNPNSVTYRQLLSIDQVRWQTTASTWSRWAVNWLLLAYDDNNNNITRVDAVLYRLCLYYGRCPVLDGFQAIFQF